MKLIAEVVYGKFRSNMELQCGLGDKTFKWLGTCVVHRYALSRPNGALRSRENCRGLTADSNNHASVITLTDGQVPHPMSLISDYCADGDSLTVKLIDGLEVGKDGRAILPQYLNLANVHSVAAPDFIDSEQFIDSAGSDEGYEVPSTARTIPMEDNEAVPAHLLDEF